MVEAPEPPTTRPATVDGGIDNTIMGLPPGHGQWQGRGSSIDVIAAGMILAYPRREHRIFWAARQIVRPGTPLSTGQPAAQKGASDPREGPRHAPGATGADRLDLPCRLGDTGSDQALAAPLLNFARRGALVH